MNKRKPIRTHPKSTPKADKVKLELKQLRKDLKKLKKSKKRMQILWYRTKKEHMALIKDIDQRLKTLRKKMKSK
jgi:hypothetical protein